MQKKRHRVGDMGMSDNFDLLQQAIERNTPIMLAMPSAAVVKPYRSRLLQITDEGIYLESITGQGDAIDALIAAKRPVSVAFRADVRRVEFTGPILKRLRGYRLNATTLIEALVIQRPEEVKAVQRRADYRVSVPTDSEISFQFHRVTEQADLIERPPATAAMVIDVRDFSAGGCGGTWKRKKDEPKLVPDQRLRVEIDSVIGKVVLDARVRFFEQLHEPEFVRVGIQFSLNANSIPDRQKMLQINKLMGELQRMELRRKRLAR
jgi:c-di-GMP-binding flagellar brake protein YcgR